MRNRRHRQRRGPLVVYAEDNGIVKAFRNIPGVELANVRTLNLLQLAPGGHMGRFIIWTQNAFALLDQIYGTYRKASALKKDYSLPSHIMSNPDVTRIINSAEVQGSLKAAGPSKTPRPYTQKKNPLKSMAVMNRLNPYAQTLRRAEILKKTQKKSAKKAPKTSAAFLNTLHAE
jgi:large subunit ribosomal protein L4e